MEAQRLYETWAPPDAVWSPWAKPVLFTGRRDGRRRGESEQARPWSWRACRNSAGGFGEKVPQPSSSRGYG